MSETPWDQGLEVVPGNKDKGKVLHVGWSHFRQQFRLRSGWLGIAAAERDLSGLTDEELNRSLPSSVPVTTTSCTGGWVSRNTGDWVSEQIPPMVSHLWVVHVCTTVFSLGLPSTGKLPTS